MNDSTPDPGDKTGVEEFTQGILDELYKERDHAAETEDEEEPLTPDSLLTQADARRVPSNNAYEIAQHLVETDPDAVGFRAFKIWRGIWYRYAGTHWKHAHDEVILDMLWTRLGRAVYPGEKNIPKPLAPTRGKLEDVKSAMSALLRIWHEYDDRTMFDPETQDGKAWEGISMSNGLLETREYQLSAHTPNLFNLTSLPFAYDVHARCPQWESFLVSILDDDVEAYEFLQDMAGYLISGRNDLEKIFQLVGPSRAGKGTIRDVYKALVGEEATTETGLESLKNQFGLMNVVGKSLLVIPDAEQSKKITGTPVELLKSISGNDGVTIDRKHTDPWSGKLGVRIMIVANEFVKFHDPTGALHRRLLTLSLTKSFVGREDIGLKARLLTELPGIFNWALEGLERLEKRGHFVQPESSMADAQEQADTAAPLTAFLRDYYEPGDHALDDSYETYAESLQQAWKLYCFNNNIQRDHQSSQGFGREFKSSWMSLGWEIDRNKKRGLGWRYLGMRKRSITDF
jgi:putative DNA primase/helicase